jgi:zinc transporter
METLVCPQLPSIFSNTLSFDGSVNEMATLNTIETLYGSDQNGFIWGFVFRPGLPAQSVTTSIAVQMLAKEPEHSDGRFLWLHFSLANNASLRWLEQNLDLPEAFSHALRNDSGSTRVEQDENALVATIRDILFDFAFDPEDVSTVSLCVKPNLLISARRKPLRSIERLHEAVRGGEPFRSPAELLAHLMRDQANVLVDIVRQSAYRADLIEDNLLRNRIAASRSELGLLRRTLVRLQRLLAPEPAALFRLLSKPPAWLHEDDLQDLREAAEEFAAAVADSVSLVERLKLIQEELAALVDEQNNRSLFVLTVVTVLALPINLIAGLFGMNVGGIPFSENGHGFWVVVMIVSMLTLTLAVLVSRQQRE